MLLVQRGLPFLYLGGREETRTVHNTGQVLVRAQMRAEVQLFIKTKLSGVVLSFRMPNV